MSFGQRRFLVLRRVPPDPSVHPGVARGRLAGDGLIRLIERVDPDVIVSTYPNTTEVLGAAAASPSDPCAGVLGHHGPIGAALLGEPRHRHPSRRVSLGKKLHVHLVRRMRAGIAQFAKQNFATDQLEAHRALTRARMKSGVEPQQPPRNDAPASRRAA